MSVRPRFRAAVLLGVVLAVAAGLMPAVAQPVSASAPAPSASPAVPLVESRPDVVSARIAAATQGSRVEVSSLEDEYSTTYVNPDATLTTETSVAPLRVLREGAWVPVDYTLEHVAGGWSPRVSPVPVVFSDGADVDAAGIGSGTRSVDMDWAVRLPVPTVDGPTATYDLGAGESLVLTATAKGFEQSLVLAYAPSSLPQIRLPLDTAGLSMSRDAADGFSFANADGTVVFSMPAPVMYGAAIDPATEEPLESSVVQTTLVQTADGPRLDLSPSLAWLQDPARTYPVVIDPSIAAVGGASDTFVADNLTTSQATNFQLHAGMFGGNAARAYLTFTGVSAFTGKHITAATLNLYNYIANSCTAATMHVYPLTASFGSSTVWSNKPGYSTSASWAASSSFAHGVEPGCSNAWVHVDVQKMVAGWAAGSLAYHGLQLSGTETAGSQGWAFCALNLTTEPNHACADASHRPTLSVTYNTVPGTPAGRSVKPCAVCTSPILTNSATPALTASAADADGGTLRYDFEVWAGNAATPTVKAAYGSVSGIASGATATWTVPAGKLANGGMYEYRVRAFDGTDYGPWSSGWVVLTVDTAPPAAPTVTSTQWPSDTWSSPTSGTISWNDTATDVASYSYQMDAGNWVGTTAKSATFTLPNNTEHQFSVKAVDKAGNASLASYYKFGVGTGGITSPADQDRTQQSVTLAVSGPEPYVAYQWRRGTTGAWATIPQGDVTVAGSSTNPVWPVATTSEWVWNVAATAGGDDGLIQLRACLYSSATDPSPTCLATPTNIQLTAHAFGDSYATQQVGPGTVALLTGDYSLDATDVNVTAYLGSLSLSRSLTTLEPADNSGAAGVFGPGWTASLDGPDAGAAGQTPTVPADRSYVVLTDADGAAAIYQPTSSLSVSPISYTGIGDAAADGSTLSYDYTATTPTLTLTDADGTQTVWTQVAGQWLPLKVVQTGAAAQTTSGYFYNTTGTTVGLPARIVAASPAGVDCSTLTLADTTKGCRSLAFSYSDVTVGATSVQRVTEVALIAWNPTKTGGAGMDTVPVAAYDYDSTGRLAHQWDPRITPALKTGYSYDSAGRLATLTPAGLSAWSFGYDSTGCPSQPSCGRLITVSRPDPTGGTATSTLVYGVPLSGSGLPDLRSSATSTWAQTSDLPVTRAATAVFEPDHNPAGTSADTVTSSDWPYASLTYLDVNGRAVDTAAYGAGDWQIDTTRYDATGNTVWNLTAGNRAQALSPTADTDPAAAAAAATDSASAADLLATINTYSTDGTELLDALGPLHPIAMADGTSVDARSHTVTTYDEGAPADGGPYRLPTSTVTSALGTDGTPYGTQTTHKGYDPIISGDASGWTLRQATTQTDPAGLVTTTRYNAAGQQIENRLPANPDNAAVRTTMTSYYDTGSGVCGDAAQAGLTCESGPAAQPATGSPLPIAAYQYDMYGNVTSTTETAGSTARVTATTYDDAERVTQSSITVTPATDGGTSLPAVNYSYDPNTGLPTGKNTSSGGATTSVTSGYDAIGRRTSYTDAAGNTSTTSYDIDGRITSVDDGKGTTSYSYDSSTERRGLITSETLGLTGQPDTFTVSYDPAGNPTSTIYPNGLTAIRNYDNTGTLTALNYSLGGTQWMQFTQATDAHGRVVAQASPQSHQIFGYDTSGRLTTVHDTLSDPISDTTACTTRVYTFDNDSNRTQLNSYPDDGTNPDTGHCTTDTTPATTSATFDQADRITNTGYSYDTLGRTTAVPGTDAQGTAAHAALTGDLAIGYYSNDMVASQTQAGQTRSYTLDPEQDRIATFSDGSTTTTNHYSDDADSSTWTETGTGTWTRNLLGPDGALAGTYDASGTVTLNLTNPHGDVIATSDNDIASTGPTSYTESTEYGLPRDAATAYQTYGWLGAKRRSSDTFGGLTLMGVRLYDPATGLFLSPDPVPGGNANSYAYPTDPINGYDLDGKCGLWGHNTCWSHIKKALERAMKNIGKFVSDHWRGLAQIGITIAGIAATAACLASVACAAVLAGGLVYGMGAVAGAGIYAAGTAGTKKFRWKALIEAALAGAAQGYARGYIPRYFRVGSHRVE